MTSKKSFPPSVKLKNFNFKKNTTPAEAEVTDLFSTSPRPATQLKSPLNTRAGKVIEANLVFRYRDPLDAVNALEKLNGMDIGGRAIRVGLGNDKFTNDSTQAILDRYNRFRDLATDTVPHDETERLDRGGGRDGPGNAHGGGRGRGAGGLAPNLDDSDVVGISLSSSSREALMKKLAREEPKEEPAPYGPLNLGVVC